MGARSVFTAEKPAKVEIEVGEAPEPYPEELPEFEFEDPKLVENTSLGLLEANGAVETAGSEDIRDVYFYGVAIKGDEVVAAGRAAVDRIKPNPKFVPEYNIFLTGDPRGAEISVNAMPTFFRQ